MNLILVIVFFIKPYIAFFVSNCLFSIDDVYGGLDALKNVQSIGPDDFSGMFLYSVTTTF